MPRHYPGLGNRTHLYKSVELPTHPLVASMLRLEFDFLAKSTNTSQLHTPDSHYFQVPNKTDMTTLDCYPLVTAAHIYQRHLHL